jgi:hypothetical protein
VEGPDDLIASGLSRLKLLCFARKPAHSTAAENRFIEVEIFSP